MVRKRRPQIAGSDPEYTSDFTAKLPTNMPDEVDPVERRNPVKAEQTAKPAAKTEAPSEPKVKPSAEIAPAAKPVRKPKQKTTKIAPKPKAEPVGEGSKRQVALMSSITPSHQAKLEALSTHGIATKDVMSLAGRRAIERFNPEPKFVEKPDGDRMPMRQGYKTTKAVDAMLIDDLREKHDPLKLLSDGAMLRGQFEPLFWSCMDEVITELNAKYG
ncbi:hypothetical protein [Loktanella sp. Alg231-35]|uniref:hypothetical protein n=1 Tax=Loktanella sp. Alg231-35 TaxID=1922220 RepID=UPI000D54C282|nr:hypothetical protein [Loktanella sp. Alg231-35]